MLDSPFPLSFFFPCGKPDFFLTDVASGALENGRLRLGRTPGPCLSENWPSWEVSQSHRAAAAGRLCWLVTRRWPEPRAIISTPSRTALAMPPTSPVPCSAEHRSTHAGLQEGLPGLSSFLRYASREGVRYVACLFLFLSPAAEPNVGCKPTRLPMTHAIRCLCCICAVILYCATATQDFVSCAAGRIMVNLGRC